MHFNSFMNSLRQACEIWINCAYDDATMFLLFTMQPNKMLAIEGQQHSSFNVSKCQNRFVWYRLVRLTRFLNGQYIMPQPSQLLDNGKREVLVRIQLCHLCFLVLTDLPLYVVAMCAEVSPSVC